MATTSSIYNDDEHFNYTLFLDWSNDCDLDCLWDRVRASRLSVLRPLSVILSLIGLIGIVGNILVISVFSRTVQKRTSTYLVLMLAITDLIACSIVIPGTLMKEWLFKFKSDFICKLWELMRNFAIISSATILAAIALERFLLVYKRNHKDGNKHVTIAMILVTMVTGIALGIPPMLGVGVYMKTEDGELINMKVCMPNDQLISAEGLFLYWQIVTSLFGLLILTIIILYMLIFVMVYKHSTRINNQTTSNAGLTSTKSTQRGTNFLPFIGFSKSERPNTLKFKTSRIPKNTLSLGVGLSKIQRLFKSNKRAKAMTNNQIITIKIEQNSTTSSSIPLGNSHQNLVQNSRASLKSPEPGTSGFPEIRHVNTFKKNRTEKNIKPDTAFQSHDKRPANQMLDIPATHNAAATSTNQNQVLPMKNRSAHIKTTKVLCIITTVYIIAFLPMFLITHKALQQNEILFYFYFINNAANPVIYSFMNRKFRHDIWKMFTRKSGTVWTG